MFMLTRSKSARLGRIEVLAAELRVARQTEEKAHAAHAAKMETIERFIADRRTNHPERDPNAVADQLLGLSRAADRLADAAARSTAERRALMLRLESAVLD